MSLISRIASIFRREEPRALRNKPGGMAYINSNADEGGGTEAIVGLIVQTVAYNGDTWRIDPPVKYRATHHLLFREGDVAQPGDIVTANGITDAALTPLADPSDDEKDESTEFYPPVPTDKREGVTA